MLDKNQSLKTVRSLFKLNEKEIIEIIALGGIDEISKSQVRGWLSSTSATKSGSGNSPAKTLGRFRELPEEIYDAFFNGFRIWVVDQDLIERFS